VKKEKKEKESEEKEMGRIYKWCQSISGDLIGPCQLKSPDSMAHSGNDWMRIISHRRYLLCLNLRPQTPPEPTVRPNRLVMALKDP
jgi:hypothetical protein